MPETSPVHVCMFVSNRALNDPRVTREGEVAVQAGLCVTVIARQGRDEDGPLRVVQRGVEFIRPKVRSSRLVARLRRLRGGSPTVPNDAKRPAEATPGQANGAGREAGIGQPGIVRRAVNGLWAWRRSVLSFHQRLRAALSVDADVYHAHDCDTLLIAWLCARLRNRPLVYDSHELWVDWRLQGGESRMTAAVWRAIERLGTRQAALCITVSDGLADILLRRYRPRKMVVVLNCPRIVSLNARLDRSAARAACGIGPAEKVVLYQGVIRQHRGLDVLVRAAALVPDCRVLLIGPPNEYAQELESLARSCSAGNVRFLGHRDEGDRNLYMAAADLGVVLTQDRSLSYRYSLANKVFEYFGAAVPVLASNLPEYRRLIERTRSGTLSDPEDSGELAGRICAFFESDSADRLEMGERGRQAVLDELNMEEQMEPVLEFYRSCGGKRRGPR